MTSLTCGAPSGSKPRRGRRPHYSLGTRTSDLIHINNLGPFGNPVTTVTPITTLWVVGGWSQSGLAFLASIFNHQCTQLFFLGLSPCGTISYKERQHLVEKAPITYLLSPVLITKPEGMWIFSLSFSKVCV